MLLGTAIAQVSVIIRHRDRMGLNVRLGSKAEMTAEFPDVRFAPESGHCRRWLPAKIPQGASKEMVPRTPVTSTDPASKLSLAWRWIRTGSPVGARVFEFAAFG